MVEEKQLPRVHRAILVFWSISEKQFGMNFAVKFVTTLHASFIETAKHLIDFEFRGPT